MTDTPTTPRLPTLGEQLVFFAPVLTAAGGPPELHGLALSGDGRLTIAAHGSGLAVQLDPSDASALGVLLLRLASQLATQQAATVEAVDEALKRITSKAAGHA